ncbi:hypothetical protein QUA79_24790 [Microcoleus sp. F8-D1]
MPRKTRQKIDKQAETREANKSKSLSSYASNRTPVISNRSRTNRSRRFILATNILDTQEVSNRQILSEYKAQQSNERGFRFIKGPLFFTSSVFVKNPERVEAIGMIMGLCLLVYTRFAKEIKTTLISHQ